MIKRVLSKKNKALLIEMIRTDFKLRYQGSVLGYLWSLLKPLMLFAILYVVFTRFLQIGRGVPNWPISLLLGIVMWNFFTEATSSALKSIVGKGSLIRKIRIPRYMIPIASVSSAFINMMLNMIVVFVFILFAKDTAFSPSTLVVFPLLILELVVLSLATGFFLAALYVKYRDIEHIWEVTRQALFYTVPIIYPLSRIPSEEIQRYLMLNPLAQIIQSARAVTTWPDAPTITTIYDNRFMVLIPFGLVVVAMIVSSVYFRQNSKNFAEDI